MPSKLWDGITYPFLNFNGANNFIPQFIMDMITYPCWDYSETVLVKEGPGFIECLLDCRQRTMQSGSVNPMRVSL